MGRKLQDITGTFFKPKTFDKRVRGRVRTARRRLGRSTGHTAIRKKLNKNRKMGL